MTAAAREAARLVHERVPDAAPRVGLILGSGLGGLAGEVEDAAALSYADLPGFPQPGVEGHAGRLVLGRFGGVPVACLQGRAHAYEGDIAAMAAPVRTLKLLGCEVLFATNAAGCLVPDWQPGSLMAIADHINLMPGNPLAGPNDPRFGPRFPDMTHAYDADLRTALRACARDLGVTLHEGVYIACLGPNFETPAEIRAFRTLGADAVGMSTVPEVLVARHCGLRVAAVSVLTNWAAGLTGEPLSHDETLHHAARAAHDLTRLVQAFVAVV